MVTIRKDEAHLDCQLEHRAHAIVVSVTGVVVLATEAIFAQAVRDALRQAASTVVIDLTGVSFLASPGLAVLVEAQENAMRTQKDLHVVVGSAAAKRTIELTGLAQILSLAPDVQTALGSS